MRGEGAGMVSLDGSAIRESEVLYRILKVFGTE